MPVRWLQAVIDIPADRFPIASAFWRMVSASEFGEVHPDHDEFIHLVRSDGDMHLELQRTDDDHHGVHLDLLVADIDKVAARSVELGARLGRRPRVARRRARLGWRAVRGSLFRELVFPARHVVRLALLMSAATGS